MTDWSKFQQVYGLPEEISVLIDRFSADPNSNTISLLSAILYSYDGRVYPVSFAALPKLAAVAKRIAPAQRFEILRLAGRIVGAEDQLPELGNIWERYSNEISTFLYLTRESLATPDCSTGDFIDLLEATLVFEGESFWSTSLSLLIIGEFEVYCPNCHILPLMIMAFLLQTMNSCLTMIL
jgi:hypothetical protein